MQKKGRINNNNKNKNRKKNNQRGTRELAISVPQPIGFPDRYHTTLRYSDSLVINPGVSYGQYTFRGNSLFDPDYTSTGHQPLYFDQLSAVYGRYRVISCLIKLKVISVGSVATQMVIIPVSEVTTFTSQSLALEHPRAKVLPIVGVSGYQTASSSYNMSTRKILGLTQTQLQDIDYSAATSANPLQLWYYIVYAYEPGGGNVHTAFTVTLDYVCEFFDRDNVSSS